MNNFATGANTMTMQFAPTDVNDSGYSATLPTITLNITDSITPPAQGAAQHPSNHHLPQRARGHARDAEDQHHQHGHRAGGKPRCCGDCQLRRRSCSGSISQLAPGATDASDMSVGLNTSSAGALSAAR